MVFRRRRHDPLVDVDETTPHRFAVSVAEPGDIDAAVTALSQLRSELTLRVADDWLMVASTKSPREAAVLRPLSALKRAGVGVAGVEFLDLVEVADRRVLAGVITDWQRNANRGPARRRAEAIGGTATLDALHRIIADQDPGDRGAGWFVFGCAAFNTPGSERGVLRLAARDSERAAQLVGCALDRCSVAELTATPASFAVDDLLAVLATGGYAAERALGLVRLLPAPLAPEVRDELLRLAERDDAVAASAVALLGHAEADLELREVLDELILSASTAVRASALAAASQLWGGDLRPVWHNWLNDRSAPLRETAEEMLGAYGDLDDIDVAAAHLAKLIRRRPGQVSWHVPREARLIELLLRHRGEPTVEAAFDNLYARWSRLNPDIHDWFRRTHPRLVPDDDGETIASGHRTDDHNHGDDVDEEAVVDDIVWPLPTIEIAGSSVTLGFDSTDMFDNKDRLEGLCATHPAITVIDADRELLQLDIDDPDPTSLILQLWADAGGGPTP
ncbi:MAG TPA: hypothetical protein VES40_20290 [Ilumatobacteraceae bacterium]|nr:hypothetical protein [Ilumatobacteraceae bacterium]